MFRRLFFGESSSRKSDFSAQRELSDKSEASAIAGGGSRKSFLFTPSPYIGIKLSPELRRDLEILHFSALEDEKSHQYRQMEAKYTRILDQFKLCFNDYKINKNTVNSKNIAIQNLIKIAYYNRGIARFEQSKWAAALEDFQTLLQLDETNLYALFYRGLSYTRLNKHRLANADFCTVRDASLTWKLDLPSLSAIETGLSSEEADAHLVDQNSQSMDAYALNTLVFHAPDSLHYLSLSGTRESMTISDASLFYTQIQARLASNAKALLSLSAEALVEELGDSITTRDVSLFNAAIQDKLASNTRNLLTLTTEILVDELSVTIPYFPRFLANNARLRIAMSLFDWPNARAIAQSILQALPPQETMSPQEAFAAFELNQIAQQAEEAILRPVRKQPTNPATSSSSKVVPLSEGVEPFSPSLRESTQPTRHLESEPSFFKSTTNLKIQPSTSSDFRLENLEGLQNGSVTKTSGRLVGQLEPEMKDDRTYPKYRARGEFNL